MNTRRGIATLLVTAMFAAMSADVAAQGTGRPLDAPAHPDVLAAFDELQAHVATAAGLNPGQRTSLLAKLDSAERLYASGKACQSTDVLGAYLNEAEGLGRSGRTPSAQDLHRRGWMLRFRLLENLPDGMTCGIGIEWIVDTDLRPVREFQPGEPPRP